MASRGVNKVILIGNLGNDPDSRSFPDGSVVTNISVATSESWKDKNTGQMQERTEWHRVSMRDRGAFKLGQIAAQYLRKGSKVFIEGRLQTRKWQDAQGVDRYTTEVVADNMQMLDSRPEGAGSYAPEQSAYGAGQPQQQAAPSYQQQAPQQNYAANSYQQQAPAQQQPPAGFNDFDDDIPF